MGPSESSLIARILAGTTSARRPSYLPIGATDDAALLRARPGRVLALTCDWFLEGTHFLPDRHPPEAVGWKALARATSDLAAMGATPRCFLLSLALPDSRTGAWLDGFLKGLRSASRKLRCPLAGGDTTRRNQVLINITVAGEVRRGRSVLRSGARPGDAVFVTGRLGEAQYGLELVLASRGPVRPHHPRLRKHLYPEPRLAVGASLASLGLATAMMDLSDGLSSDLPRLCMASGVGARVDAAKLPKVKLPSRNPLPKFDPLSAALHGGDDYELLFTVARKNLRRIPKRLAGVTVTRIGEITRHKEVVLASHGGTEPLAEKGWDPFR